MADSDSLVATRARRPNAGSRLKHLIEIEEQASGVRKVAYNEEDENVQLLFQEDENDEEFEESEQESSGEEEEPAEDDEDQTGEAETATDNRPESPSDNEKAVDSDDVLSDSDISLSEDDDSEGERELQKEERVKKRKTKSATIIPAIKKRKPAAPKPKPKPRVNNAEDLLDTERRASSRKSALKNKQNLIQKLKEDESRRALLTPVVRVKERRLTQEERLAEAVETEKLNVASLHSFLEQEIVKKERQKLLFQQRRVKLRNVIRLISREAFVSPVDEIEDARKVIDLARKRKGKRRRWDSLEEPRPGDIDTSLPYYRKEMEEKRIREMKEAEEKQRLEKEREERRKRIEAEQVKRRLALEEERAARKLAKENRFKEFADVDITEHNKKHGSQSSASPKSPEVPREVSEPQEEPEYTSGLHNGDDANKSPEKVTKSQGEAPSSLDIAEGDSKPEALIETESPQPELTEKDVSAEPAAEAESHDQMDGITETIAEAKTEDEGNDPMAVDTPVKEESENGEEVKEETEQKSSEATEREATEDSVKGEKRVTFADDGTEKTEDAEEPVVEEEEYEEEEELAPDWEHWYRPDSNGWIYEGPVQYVGKNELVLLEFDQGYTFGLSEARIKTILFGDDANLGPTRRFREVETILRSSLRSDNPYAPTKEPKEDALLKPVTEINEEDQMFEILDRLPRLGDKDIVEEVEMDEQKEETTDIKIKTEAPSSLYLPNDNKKLCLISGKEVRYFDPFTGIPYENKDMYQVIKTIEQGHIPWLNIGKDTNSYGAVEIYLNNREGSRHAKGVPEGFDGW